MIHIIVSHGRGNITSIKLLISTRVAKTIKYIYCSSDTRVFFLVSRVLKDVASSNKLNIQQVTKIDINLKVNSNYIHGNNNQSVAAYL